MAEVMRVCQCCDLDIYWGEYMACPFCNWIYDADVVINGKVMRSVSSAKNSHSTIADVYYNWDVLNVRGCRRCQCCLKNVISQDGDHEICPLCDWQQEFYLEAGGSIDLDDDSGANGETLREARARWFSEHA
jgi:hypothetical protein